MRQIHTAHRGEGQGSSHGASDRLGGEGVGSDGQGTGWGVGQEGARS